MRLCRPPYGTLAAIVVAVGLAYSTKDVDPGNVFASLLGIVRFYLAVLITVVAAPLYVGYSARSAVLASAVGVVGIMFLQDALGFVKEALTVLAIIVLFIAWRVGARDAVLEYLFSGSPRYHVSPALATLSIALALSALEPIPGVFNTTQYWILVFLGALVAARISKTPIIALLSSLAAAVPLGSLILLWTATFLPLPAPRCPGARVGVILAVEGEAAPPRLAFRATPKSSRGLVCVEKAPATVYSEEGTLIWVYTRNPSRMVAWLAEAIASARGSNYLLIDVDSPGPDSLGGLEEALESGDSRLRLGSLHPEEAKVALSAVVEKAASYDTVAIAWCNPDIDYLARLLTPIRSRASVILVSSCTIPAGSLTPIKGVRRTQVVITRTSDPLELAAALTRILGEGLGQDLARALAGDPRLMLILPYCNRLVGLASRAREDTD